MNVLSSPSSPRRRFLEEANEVLGGPSTMSSDHRSASDMYKIEFSNTYHRNLSSVLSGEVTDAAIQNCPLARTHRRGDHFVYAQVCVVRTHGLEVGWSRGQWSSHAEHRRLTRSIDLLMGVHQVCVRAAKIAGDVAALTCTCIEPWRMLLARRLVAVKVLPQTAFDAMRT